MLFKKALIVLKNVQKIDNYLENGEKIFGNAYSKWT
jgi:hypothetical protein